MTGEIRRDLSHVPTETLKKLIERYQARLKIAQHDEAMRQRLVTVGGEYGMRLMVKDIEADIKDLLS